MEERKTKLFDSYADFDKRVARKQCNNRSRTMLERIGAFSSLDGSPSDAIQKYEEVPILGQYQNQLEVLGYVVPSRSLLRKIQAAGELPTKRGYTRFAGFISKVTKKKSIHGEYTVFTLSPSGQFWTRTPKSSFKVGAFITGTKSKFGHSIDAKVYRLDTGE
jgi:DNA polymerase III alpha subunit